MPLGTIVNLAALKVSGEMKEEALSGYRRLDVLPISWVKIIITNPRVMLFPLIHKEEN